MKTLQFYFAAYALPRLECVRLASFALQQSRAWVLAHETDALTALQAATVEAALQRRAKGEPVAYIEGVREFYGLDFAVSPACLIPRAETEILVDFAVTHASRFASVLELATGSGAIAVSLKKARSDCAISASDISPSALAIAAQNAQIHAADIHFVQSDWYQSIIAKYHCIIANPPYIHQDDEHLGLGDCRFEPRLALTDEADGLQALVKIILHAPQFLQANGWLLVEHGYDQAAPVAALFAQAGFGKIKTLFDAALEGSRGNARATFGQL